MRQPRTSIEIFSAMQGTNTTRTERWSWTFLHMGTVGINVASRLKGVSQRAK